MAGKPQEKPKRKRSQNGRAPADTVDSGADGRGADGRFTSSPNNKGRHRGSKNKRTLLQIQAAKEYFEELLPVTKAVMKGHLDWHKDGKQDCGTCVRFIEMVHHYVFGKPTQPLEIDNVAQRERLERLAEEYGVPIEELERRAERIGMPLIAGGRRVG